MKTYLMKIMEAWFPNVLWGLLISFVLGGSLSKDVGTSAYVIFFILSCGSFYACNNLGFPYYFSTGLIGLIFSFCILLPIYGVVGMIILLAVTAYYLLRITIELILIVIAYFQNKQR